LVNIYKSLRTLAEKLGRAPAADQELAISEDSVFRKWNLYPYSPDKLIQRKKFEIFEEMVKDDQIAQCIAARKLLLLSPGWEVVPANESDEAQRQADFITWNFDKALDGAFSDDIWEIAGAQEIGWSLSEKVYSVAKEGDWAGFWFLKALKSKNPKDFNLVRDDYDNLLPDGISRITHPQLGMRLPASKFVLYSYRKRYEDLFGTSVLRSLYDLWWIKHVLKRAMGVHFERAGVPVAVGKYPSGMKTVDQDKLFQLVKSIRFESAAVIPKEVELMFSEARSKSGEHFIGAIKHIDEQISKTILGQTLTQSQGDRGSQALGNVHKDILVLYVEELGRDIATKAIQAQIIKDLIDFNFPQPLYPTFVFKPIAPEDEKPRVDAFLAAADKGAVMITEKDEAEIRRILGFEEREAEDKLLSAQQDAQTPPDGAGPSRNTPGDKPAIDKKAVTEELAERIFTGVRRRTLTGPEQRVNFAETLRTIEVDGVEDIMSELSPLMVQVQEDLLAQLQRKKIMENQDTAAIQDLTIRNLSDIKAVLKNGLVKMARRGRKSAAGEVNAARKEAKMAEPFNVAKFLPEEVEKLFTQKAFMMTGAIKDQVLGIAKNSIFASLKNGLGYREAAAGLKDVLEPYVSSGAADAALAGGPRLETIVRTNVVDAYNSARMEEFKRDTQFVQGLQYSAILDDRVRESHAAMDGRQYKTDDPIWDSWNPPNGYNCRCVLIPVTLVDGDFVPSKPPPASVVPDPGFKENGS
jgi:SPP1 gp7 family putative phage head morphogenesis protein